MIITRIRRGASRTSTLMKRNMSPLSAIRSTAHWVRISKTRIAAVGLLAARIATAPVPVAAASPALAGNDSADIPPSTLAAVRFLPTAADSLQIAPPTLQPVSVGVSRQAADEAALALAAQLQAQRLANQAASAARSERYAAEQEAAAEAQRLQAAKPVTPSGFAPTDLVSILRERATAELGAQEANAMIWIGERESGVTLNSYNASSGACGIWQALPCSKMGGMDLDHQYAWVKEYALARYGSFVNAQAYWQSHHVW